MPDSYNDRTPTPSASPKPARTATASPAINASPTVKAVATGGTDNKRAAYETYRAPDSRPETSALDATDAAVASFADATV